MRPATLERDRKLSSNDEVTGQVHLEATGERPHNETGTVRWTESQWEEVKEGIKRWEANVEGDRLSKVDITFHERTQADWQLVQVVPSLSLHCRK